MTDMLLAFYKNEIRHPSTGKYLYDIIHADDDFLEKCHDYIQWVFPNDVESKFNPDAPLLDKEFLKEFVKDKGMQSRAYEMHTRFKTFLVSNKSRIFRQPRNHNHLRISRIIRFHKLVGSDASAQYFYDLCVEFVDKYADPKSDDYKYIRQSVNFWKKELNG